MRTRTNTPRLLRGGAVCAALALALLTGTARAQSVAPGTEDPNNWPQYYRTSNGWRYSPLDQINKDNVSHLHVAWINQAGEIAGGLQETPLVIDGVVYSISAGNRVSAIDGKAGKEIWRHDVKLDPFTEKMVVPPFSRGVTVGAGKVFFGTFDGRAIALDQKTGKEIWSVRLTDIKNCGGCFFPSPPVFADGVLTFGTAFSETSNAGKIFGVDAENGKKLWVFEVIKNDPESWPDPEVAKYGGGGAWLPGTYDPKTDTVYYGTSNPASAYFGEDRKGDNLYTGSVLAIEPRTGKLKWYRQEIPHDVWDYDSGYESLIVNRNGMDLLVHLNKSGFVFVMDKNDGKVENVWPLVRTYNFAKGIDPKTGVVIGRNEPVPGKRFTVCPSGWGGRSWNHGAYNPKTGLWYTNVLELCAEATPMAQAADPHAPALIRLGVKDDWRHVKPEGLAPGRLDARDPITGEAKWSYESSLPLLGSVLTTGGGLVFNGDPHGIVKAFDADTGKVLWSFNTGSGIRGGMISYAINRKQYILVPSGWASFAAMVMPSAFPKMANLPGGASLIAFTLD